MDFAQQVYIDRNNYLRNRHIKEDCQSDLVGAARPFNGKIIIQLRASLDVPSRRWRAA